MVIILLIILPEGAPATCPGDPVLPQNYPHLFKSILNFDRKIKKLNNGKGNQSRHKADIEVAEAEQMPAWCPTQGFALASPSPLKWEDSPFSPKVQL